MKHAHEVSDLLSLEPELRRVALESTRNQADADDVLQDMWLAVLKKRPRGVTSERAWLGRIIRNLSASLARSESARRRRENANAEAETGEATDAVVERAALRRHLLECVLEMDPAYRRVLLMRYVADMEPSEIAEYFGMPASTVRVQTHRGLEALRRRLGTDDPRRHHALVALMAPGLIPRRLPRFALGLAAVGLVITCAVIAVRSDSDEDGVIETAFEDVSAPAQPRRARTPVDEIVAATPKPEGGRSETPLTVPRLTGNVAMLLDGEPLQTQLTIDIEYLGNENAGPRLAMGAHNDEDWTCGPPDASFKVAAGEPFSLPLRSHALLRVFIRGRDVAGGLIVYHTSRAPLERSIRLLPHLMLEAAPGSRPSVRAPVGTTDEEITAVEVGDGRWHVPGPLFPGLQVTLDQAEPRFWRRVMEPSANLTAIMKAGLRSVRLIDAALDRPMATVRVDMTTWTGDHRVFTTTLSADVDGVLRVPLLAPRDRALGDRLLIEDSEGRGWSLEPVTEILETMAPSDVLDLRVGLTLRGGGTLFDPARRPLGGLDVSARLPDGSVLTGASDERGRFTLSPAGGRPRPRRIAAAVVALGATDAPTTVTVEVSSPSGYAVIADVSWEELERGVADLTCRLESEAPAPTRFIRVVDAAGHPLTLVRVSVAYPDGRTIQRVVTDHDGRVAYADLFPGEEVSINILAPGRRPSLSTSTRIPGDVQNAVVETVRIRDVELDGSAFVDAPFLAVIVEDVAREHRRHGFFSAAPMRSIPLNEEEQRITVYVPGRLPESTTWSPDDALLHLDHRSAGELEVRLPEGMTAPEGRAVLRVVKLGDDPRHVEPLAQVLRRFDVQGTATEDGRLQFDAVPPGEWALFLGDEAADAEVARFTLRGAGPHTIDLGK